MQFHRPRAVNHYSLAVLDLQSSRHGDAILTKVNDFYIALRLYCTYTVLWMHFIQQMLKKVLLISMGSDARLSKKTLTDLRLLSKHCLPNLLCYVPPRGPEYWVRFRQQFLKRRTDVLNELTAKWLKSVLINLSQTSKVPQSSGTHSFSVLCCGIVE